MLAVPIALLLPLPLKIAVDSVVGSKPVPGFLDAVLPGAPLTSDSAVLIMAACLFALVSLLHQLQMLGTVLISSYTGEKMVLAFRDRLFGHVQRLALAYHDTRGPADSAYRIQYDAPAIQYIAVDGVIPITTAAFTLIGMVVVTALIDWQLALIAIAVVPALLFVFRFYSSRLRTQWHEAKNLETSAMSVVQEVVSALRVVRAFGQEEREQRRFVDRSSEGARARIHLSFTEGAFSVLVGMTTALGTAAVLYIGTRHVQSGELTLGELLLIMGYLVQLYDPLEAISRKAADLQSSVASAERAFALLDEEIDLKDRPNARRLRRARGGLSFRDVSFAYEEEREVLRDVSFEATPGSHLGIVGTTGAGKTTLISLLTRFYDPTSGQILLDGVDLRDYRIADLRQQFAIVLQEPVLFSTTIAENIAYGQRGRRQGKRSKIVAAAKAAGAHEFIEALPEGYQTQVGERGARLSGGERQRISLARAFLKDAPILILDEPTSAVDVHTEAAIIDAMQRLMAGRTSFIISHRLSTLAGCDLYLQLEDGQVAETSPEQFAATVAPDAAGQERDDSPDRADGRTQLAVEL